jgi:hypothetical protein
MNETVSEYWLRFYCDELCTLCGNTGVVDTRATAVSRTGISCGRLNYCICPNGQTMRSHKADLEKAAA